MTFIYEQPRSITIQEKEYIKECFESMLKHSMEEFNKWKKDNNEIFLKQACEKLFCAAEHFVELKRNIDITKHYQFRHEFRSIKGINKNTVNNLIDMADSLHQFFYNGQMYESDIPEIEKKYHTLYQYLKEKIKER
jgi:endonuclease III-like uncharacterized protein